jgi:hypothetical protein
MGVNGNSSRVCVHLDVCQPKSVYSIQMLVVPKTGNTFKAARLSLLIKGEPDAPEVWLVENTAAHAIVEWSEPKTYGIPVSQIHSFVRSLTSCLTWIRFDQDHWLSSFSHG